MPCAPTIGRHRPRPRLFVTVRDRVVVQRAVLPAGVHDARLGRPTDCPVPAPLTPPWSVDGGLLDRQEARHEEPHRELERSQRRQVALGAALVQRLPLHQRTHLRVLHSGVQIRVTVDHLQPPGPDRVQETSVRVDDSHKLRDEMAKAEDAAKRAALQADRADSPQMRGAITKTLVDDMSDYVAAVKRQQQRSDA